MRGSPPIAFGTGAPSQPPRPTSTPAAASARAWYNMRALRPRSPSATTAALMGNDREGGSILRESMKYEVRRQEMTPFDFPASTSYFKLQTSDLPFFQKLASRFAATRRR